MTFLPIVERELRVAARKRSSFLLRVVAALVAVVIGAGCLAMSSVGSFRSAGFGSVLFGVLTWMSLAAALSAGLFFTSDCISEEKREGTLGFLFLTDLRGYDVVGGKLLATSLRGFYALLAILPILAATLLMGGVTGAQFWKTSLALTNALVCSLAAGLFVSTISRDSQKAMAGTLILLLLIAGGGPLADVIIRVTKGHVVPPVFRLTSPVYAFGSADAWGRSGYWPALGLTHSMAWLLLGLACWLAPRTWQQRSQRPASHSTWVYAWKFGGEKRRARLRSKLMDLNPVFWLACRERWQALGMWVVAIVVVTGLGLMTLAPSEAWMVLGWLSGVLTLVGYLWMASQAGRFFIEARQSGLLELILSAPLAEREIIGGQWRGLVRLFAAPLLVLLMAQLLSAFLMQLSIHGIISQATSAAVMAAGSKTNASGATIRSGPGYLRVTPTTPNSRIRRRPAGASTNSQALAASTSSNVSTTNATGTVVTSTWVTTPPPAFQINWNADLGDVVFAFVFAAATTVSIAGNLLALCWFGMWMGVTSKTAHLATLKTILFVQIVPWLVISFGSSMLPALFFLPRMFSGIRTGSINLSPFTTWYPALISSFAALLALGKDIGFVLWSRKQLYSRFREWATRSPGQPRLVSPPPPPPVRPEIEAPPVIA
jgi:hypothetical protein